MVCFQFANCKRYGTSIHSCMGRVSSGCFHYGVIQSLQPLGSLTWLAGKSPAEWRFFSGFCSSINRTCSIAMFDSQRAVLSMFFGWQSGKITKGCFVNQKTLITFVFGCFFLFFWWLTQRGKIFSERYRCNVPTSVSAKSPLNNFTPCKRSFSSEKAPMKKC